MACVSRVAGFGLIYSFFLLDGLISTRYLFPFWHYNHKGFIGINQDGQPDPPRSKPRDPLNCMATVHPS